MIKLLANGLVLIIYVLVMNACSAGSSRSTVNPNIYGQLQSYNFMKTFTVTSLQTQVESLGVCNGVTLTDVLIDNYFSAHPLSPHTGADLCNSNIAFIESSSNSNLFGNNFVVESFIQYNSFGSSYHVESINAYQIIYNTPGQPYYYAGGYATNETVSGLVLTPNIPESQIQGIIVYYHPTVLSKFEVPSMTSVTQETLASVYASQGYIVIAPDYVGQGVDVAVMHPYVLYTQVNAVDGINMLNAAINFLITTKGYNFKTYPYNQHNNIYLSSYSEGGAYAIWASRYLQGSYANILTNNSLTLKRAVGISGAYDLSSAMVPYAYDVTNNINSSSINPYNASFGMESSSPYYFDEFLSTPIPDTQQTLANFNMSVSKASLGTYAFTSFITYNYTPAAYPVFFKGSNFINMTTCVDFNSYVLPTQSQVVPVACPLQSPLSNIFMNANSNYTSENIGLNIVTAAMYSNGFFNNNQTLPQVIANIKSGGTTNNSIISFASEVLTDPFLMNVIGQANTSSFVTTNPISLLYLNYDSTVTNINSLHACDNTNGVKGLSSNGLVTCLNVNNTQLYTTTSFGESAGVVLPLMMDHSQAEYTLNLIALNQIKNTQ